MLRPLARCLICAFVLGPFIAHSSAFVDTTVERPTNSESASLLLDVTNHLAKQSGSVVLVVARLGTGERNNSLNRRRLASVRKFVSQCPSYTASFYYAEGDRVDGLGRIEIYVLGKLVDEPGIRGVILAAKNSDVQLWMPDV